MDKFRSIVAKTLRIIRIIALIFVIILGTFTFIAKNIKLTFIDDFLDLIHYPWPYDSFWLICAISLVILVISHVVVEKYFKYD